jgi:RHH-type proline utilization regulon transcriptional repressor/proline dehydrogenase/delta 1-pyrroline-5-carboxylate dehydrogenase
LPVGIDQDRSDGVGPLVEPATGDVLAALTELGEGEEWLIEPHRLDEAGCLWSPGVRDGVRPGSRFHLGSPGAPVLGLMRAEDLAEAIDLHNALPAGLAAGIHSLDPDEVTRWLATAQAGNLYVNRDTLGAAAQRQPFGGWKRSTFGPAPKTGGPNSLFTLGRFEAVFPEPRKSVVLRGMSDPIARLIEAAQPGMDYLGFDRVRAAARSDQTAWDTEFGTSRDLAGLELERDVFRYRPVPVAIRLAEGTPPWQLVRVIAAALRAGSPISISSAVPIAASLVRFLHEDVPAGRVTGVVVETDARWYARLLEGEAGADRIRLLGGEPAAALAVLGSESAVSLYAQPVTAAGRIELLTFLREQSVSIAAHRFGHLDAAMAALVV